MSNKLLMPFIGKNDNPLYIKGFECGQIWEQMKQNKSFNKYLFHTENIKQIEMVCKRFLYDFNIEKIDETWSELTAVISNKVN